ncbi:MAG: hypothetical protein JJU11_07175 [Candidatus Sumerlaeia bacterium]|nr:hypothetical protein [Candidatus Sumerlaeia bacterium]
MAPTVIFLIVLVVCIFFLFQITAGNRRLKRVMDRDMMTEDAWVEEFADQFPGLAPDEIRAGLRFAADGFNFEATLLRPEDSWGGVLAPPSKVRLLDPAFKDWEALATSKGVGPDQMAGLTLRDFILHYGPRPEAQAFLGGREA